MSKVILMDSSGIFVPTVKVVQRMRMENAKRNSNTFVMPPITMYFNSFISCLSKIGVNEDDIVIVAGEGHSFRKDFMSEYKSQRIGLRQKDTFIDWAKEFNTLNNLHKLLDEATNWYFVRVANGLEADDIIAIACRYFKDKECIVVSGDCDLHQLAYYENVRIFNLNKKSKGTKGTYEKVDNPLKIIEKKARLGDVADNIIPNKLTDTDEDYNLRYFVVNLLRLPDYIEQRGIDALSNLPKKEMNLDILDDKRKTKILKIFKKDKIITPEYCYELIEKRKAKKKKKLSEKNKAKRLAKKDK